MRRFILGWAIAAFACAQPAWAVASDQQIAQSIADQLRASGQLVDYSVGVKYQDGTVWLSGRVSSPEQLERAIQLTEGNPDVALVVSHLEVRPSNGGGVASAPAAPSSRSLNPLTRLASPPLAMRQNVGQVTPAYYAPETQEPRTLAVPPPAQMPNTARRAPATSRGPVPQQVQMQQVPRQGQPQYVQPQYGQPQYGQPQYGPPQQRMPQYVAANYGAANAGMNMQAGPAPMGYYGPAAGTGVTPAAYDQPSMPNYAWPSYAAYPNYAGVTYPKQYSPTAWPYIGPFYPYPQVPLGWRKVTLEWDDGWWFLDFDDKSCH